MSGERKNIKKKLLRLTALISILVLLICAVRLLFYSAEALRLRSENNKLKSMIGESSVSLSEDLETGRPITVSDSTPSLVTPEEKTVLDKYKSLYEINPDIVGWISVENTKIDYPVMQTIYDEEFYLHRNFYKEDSKNGLPFMDSRCITRLPSTNLIIFGHNMKSGDMFHDLLKYEKKSFYDNHKYIRFDTIYEEALYEIVAVFRTRVAYKDENTFRFYNFLQADSEEEFYDYYNTIRSMSLYETDAEAVSSDYLLTLATCEYSVEDGRFVVVARKISDLGDITQ